jgi:hypothetical protein
VVAVVGTLTLVLTSLLTLGWVLTPSAADNAAKEVICHPNNGASQWSHIDVSKSSVHFDDAGNPKHQSSDGRVDTLSGPDGLCPGEAPSPSPTCEPTEPTGGPTTEPTENTPSEPTDNTSTEPTEDPPTEPTDNTSTTPTDDGTEAPCTGPDCPGFTETPTTEPAETTSPPDEQTESPTTDGTSSAEPSGEGSSNPGGSGSSGTSGPGSGASSNKGGGIGSCAAVAGRQASDNNSQSRGSKSEGPSSQGQRPQRQSGDHADPKSPVSGSTSGLSLAPRTLHLTSHPPVTTLDIAALHVRAPVIAVGAPGGLLRPPDNPLVIGWWGGGVALSAGHGRTILTGHTVHSGGGAFDDLGSLATDAKITLGRGAHAIRYAVTDVSVYSRSGLERRASQVFRQTGPAALVLVTCAGWNGATFRNNVVVTARPR